MLASPMGSALVSHQIPLRLLPASFPHWYYFELSCVFSNHFYSLDKREIAGAA